jgi:hypothetical protein
MDGMTSPKPGPIKEPSISTAHAASSEGSGFGDDMGDDADWYAVSGNPSKGMLGGDSRTDLGQFAVAGNPPVGSVMDHDYGNPGDKPLRVIEGNPGRDEVKSWFRNGSDALGMDGRDNGT